MIITNSIHNNYSMQRMQLIKRLFASSSTVKPITSKVSTNNKPEPTKPLKQKVIAFGKIFRISAAIGFVVLLFTGILPEYR